MDFDSELFETPKYNWPDTVTRLPNDAASGDVDDYVTEDERNSAHEEAISSHAGGKYNPDLNPPPTLLMNTDTSQTTKIKVPSALSTDCCIFPWNQPD